MKGHNERCTLGRRHERSDPLSHLPRRFVGEGDGKNLPSWHPFADKARNAMRDRLGLTGTRARDDQQGPRAMSGCFSLSFVESIEVIECHFRTLSWSPVQYLQQND